MASRRQLERSPAAVDRRLLRGSATGLAVPAVIGMGALPAFAAHSDLIDEADDELSLEEDELYDEFGDALTIDSDEDIEDSGLYEEDYDPFAESDEAAQEVTDSGEDAEQDEVTDSGEDAEQDEATDSGEDAEQDEATDSGEDAEQDEADPEGDAETEDAGTRA